MPYSVSKHGLTLLMMPKKILFMLLVFYDTMELLGQLPPEFYSWYLDSLRALAYSETSSTCKFKVIRRFFEKVLKQEIDRVEMLVKVSNMTEAFSVKIR